MRRIYGNDKAFSLPEVLLATVLLAMVILGYIMSLTVGKTAITLSKERLVMSNLLRQEMETVLGTDYGDLIESDQSITVDDGMRNITATKTLTISTVTDPTDADNTYKNVHASIEWGSGSGGETTLSEEMAMYVTNCTSQ